MTLDEFMATLPVWLDEGRQLDEMGCQIGVFGQIGVKLPATQWVFVCGPAFARALADALESAADIADGVIAQLIGEAN